MGAPFALDFGAVMTMATVLDADVQMLAEVLPGVEAVILSSLRDDGADV